MTKSQQPIPEKPHAPGKAKENPYGESKAEKKPAQEKGKYDKPAKAADDFVIDEEREKQIRGNEAPKD
ncbi:hypothetical protein [Jannaschia rubra]|uniref:Uncharacterized protein n=1 Tax=Jannaschia rubra TaxID=282197 RepID=A0A0M6XUT6_9RHOB|nr:hypothetical protein [Jannaschia rubra]CTQ34023.1 hypothetical protein JAN5088_02814 [Jannaschia rubra]SFG24945.1 hypothetical protein SAMN04488517_103324 [Jannaschia rubra]